jgi:hypothetical protein
MSACKFITTLILAGAARRLGKVQRAQPTQYAPFGSGLTGLGERS